MTKFILLFLILIPVIASAKVANIEYLNATYLDDTVDWLNNPNRFTLKAEPPVFIPTVKQGIFFKQFRYSYSNVLLTIGSLSNNLRLAIHGAIKPTKLLSNPFPFDCRESHQNISKTVKESCETLMKFYKAGPTLNNILQFAVKSDIDYNQTDLGGSFKMPNADSQEQKNWDAYYDEREANEVFNLNSNAKDIIGLPVVVSRREDNIIPIPKNIRTKEIKRPPLDGPDPFPKFGDKILPISCNDVEKSDSDKWSRRYEFTCLNGRVLLKSNYYNHQSVEKCSSEGKSEGDVWRRYSNGVTKSAFNSSTDYLFYDIATCVEGEIVDVRSMLWSPKQCSEINVKPGEKWWTVVEVADLNCAGYSACGPARSKRKVEGAWECNKFNHVAPSSDKSFMGPGLVAQQILIDNQAFVQYIRLGDFLNNDCKLINIERKFVKDPICLPFNLPFKPLGYTTIVNYYKTRAFSALTGNETENTSLKKEGKICKSGRITFYKCGEKITDSNWKMQPGGNCYHFETSEACSN